jgi:hypothetical protein
MPRVRVYSRTYLPLGRLSERHARHRFDVGASGGGEICATSGRRIAANYAFWPDASRTII